MTCESASLLRVASLKCGSYRIEAAAVPLDHIQNYSNTTPSKSSLIPTAVFLHSRTGSLHSGVLIS